MWIILRGGPPHLHGRQRNIEGDGIAELYIENHNVFRVTDGVSDEGLPIFQFDKQATAEHRRKLDKLMKKAGIG